MGNESAFLFHSRARKMTMTENMGSIVGGGCYRLEQNLFLKETKHYYECAMSFQLNKLFHHLG